MRALRGAWLTLQVAWLLALPRVALACANCITGREDETRGAFLLTTLFMSVFPLSALGGFLWWLRRRVRALESERARFAEPVGPAAEPVRTSSSR